jgi:hypothetical protein
VTTRPANVGLSKRYEVIDVATGDRFGNHTHAEAVARAQIMRRNWQYKKTFVVEEVR